VSHVDVLHVFALSVYFVSATYVLPGVNILGQGSLGCVWITRNRFIIRGHSTQHFLWTLVFSILFVHL